MSSGHPCSVEGRSRRPGRASERQPRTGLYAWLPLLAACAIPIVPFAVIGELPGERWLSATDRHALAFGAFGLALLALDVVLPVPSSVVGVMLGARLGAAFGFSSCFSGLLLGHIFGYWLGRLAPERWARQAPVAPGWLSVFASRPLPVMAEAMTLMAGAARIPFATYVTATALGDAVYAAVLSATGASLVPGGWYWGALSVPMLLIGLGAWALRHKARAEPKAS